jgi:hypothetical protein
MVPRYGVRGQEGSQTQGGNDFVPSLEIENVAEGQNIAMF